ncbi:hypothetical protein RDABS01_023944 [Bienertia sinuspersici]
MIDSCVLEKVQERCGFEHGIGISSRGKSRGMGFWWRDIEVAIVSYSNNHVAADILDHEDFNELVSVNEKDVMPKGMSDHALICLEASTFNEENTYNRPFKFEAHWLSKEECWKVVVEAWTESHSMEDPAELSWCASKLAEWASKTFGLFNEEDCKKILAIPLPTSTVEDGRFWSPVKYGEYTVKSGYWLAKLGHLSGAGENEEEKNLWRSVWKVEGPPKLSHFLWRGCKGSLAVRECLQRRHMVEEAKCMLCSQEDEAIIHVVFDCPHIADIWGQSTFEDPVQSNMHTAVGFLRMVDEYNSYAKRVFAQKGKWDWGAVFRDHMGCPLVVAVKIIETTEVEVTEAEAARYGASLARRLGFDSVVLESATSNVVHAIKSQTVGFSPIHVIYEDIKDLRSSFNFFEVKSIKRSGNIVAHHVARLNTNGCNELVYLSSFPQSIIALTELYKMN